MKLTELQQTLHTVNPAAVLVSPQVLERVIQQVCNLPALPWDVPHRKSYVVDRQDLFRHIEQDDLDLSPEYLLPATVILLVKPTSEQPDGGEKDILLGVYWRRLFHASVHLALEQGWKEGSLTLAGVRQRVEAIGQTEYNEIRRVLLEDRWLVASAAEHTFWIEFAAVFLELRYFAKNLLPIYFPSLDVGAVEELLRRDLDAAKLFEDTRLAGAPDPIMPTDTASDESHDFFYKLERTRRACRRDGQPGPRRHPAHQGCPRGPGQPDAQHARRGRGRHAPPRRALEALTGADARRVCRVGQGHVLAPGQGRPGQSPRRGRPPARPATGRRGLRGGNLWPEPGRLAFHRRPPAHQATAARSAKGPRHSPSPQRCPAPRHGAPVRHRPPAPEQPDPLGLDPERGTAAQ